MTIASAIATKQQQVADSYTAVLNKGGTLPATQNLTNLATAISSIPSGGGSTRFGLSLDNYIGQVNNGTLQTPTTFPNSIIFTGVETVAQSALVEAFENDSNVDTISFPDLVTIEQSGLFRCFYGASISSCSFPDLVTIDADGLAYAFGNTGIRSMTFPNLTTIYSGGLKYTFITAGIRELYFPALTTAFSSSFRDMLRAVSGVTVHFPFSMQSTMSSWSSVTNGFGGNSTTILFDLNGCEVTFAITPNSGNRLIVNGDELSSNIITVAKSATMNYQIYNSSYGLYISDYTTPDASTATVTTDITVPTYNTISINTSVSGLVVTATIDNVVYTMTETGNSGVYTLPIYNATGSSISVAYYVSGGGLYADVSGIITFNNSNVTETVTMQQVTERNFVRPDLTDNGTMGGNSFAVESDWEGVEHKFYMAVDGNTSTSNMPDAIYEFYNPEALKVSQLDFDFGSDSYSMFGVVLEGSNDRTNWTTINSWSGRPDSTISWSVNSSAFYKYHKLTFTPSRTYVQLYELGITATYME